MLWSIGFIFLFTVGGVTGVVLTRMDGDGRGGAALSMRAITGKPIRFVGLGEKMDALETFEPDRIAGRILGMGDIVALVEKAQETIEAEQAERMMKRFQKGQFNMNDLKMQLEQMMKMGGMEGMMGMMPGMGKMAKQIEEAGFDDKILRQQIAMISSAPSSQDDQRFAAMLAATILGDGQIALILDPMLATGGTLIATIDMLKEAGCKSIRGIFLVAAPEGLEKVTRRRPDVDIYVAAIDEKLNDIGYILPGLGDAGDKIFGTK